MTTPAVANPVVDPAAAKPVAEPPREYSIVAAVLSYLVPGLGQIYQGRIAKGLLFMVCLLGLFYYGQKLGSWSNVYMPKTDDKENEFRIPFLAPPADKGYHFRSVTLGAVYKRLPFAGQFWIGIAAWPAILQWADRWPESLKKDPKWSTFQVEPPENSTTQWRGQEWRGPSLNELQQDGDKTWDLGWVYTVIAGVLNILVIYDAFAGAAFRSEEQATPAPKQEPAVA